MSSAAFLFAFLVFAALDFHSINGDTIHVVITRDDDAAPETSEPSEMARRRIFLSNGQKLLNFTNDDANVMIDCEASESASAVRRVVLLRRDPHSEDDIWDTKRSYEDRGGKTFAEWETACAQVHKRSSSSVTRRKVFPEIVYPGTKWCGPGDDAEDYEDLGRLENTDKCCRAHDNCPVHILPFQTVYHYLNYRPYSLTHCTCDENLFNCLKVVGREVAAERGDSDMVGKVFFYEANIPCFRLEHAKYCAKRHWSKLWCEEWAWADDVAKIHKYLESEWPKVDTTEEIPDKPPTQNI